VVKLPIELVVKLSAEPVIRLSDELLSVMLMIELSVELVVRLELSIELMVKLSVELVAELSVELVVKLSDELLSVELVGKLSVKLMVELSVEFVVKLADELLSVELTVELWVKLAIALSLKLPLVSVKLVDETNGGREEVSALDMLDKTEEASPNNTDGDCVPDELLRVELADEMFPVESLLVALLEVAEELGSVAEEVLLSFELELVVADTSGSVELVTEDVKYAEEGSIEL
jgi:hypothetical protein